MKARIILFTALFLIGNIAFSQKKHYEHIKHLSELTKDSPDTVYVKAYVTFVYICPPCPPPNQCKPCIPNYFTIADDPKEVKHTIHVEDTDPEKYDNSKKHTFLLKLVKGSDQEIRYAKIIKEKK
jgi:hypothetical protein